MAELVVSVEPTGALTAATREAIIALNNRAWAEQRPMEFAELFELVTDSMHVMAWDGSVLVGHACWAARELQPDGLPPLRTAYVDAVATEPARQRTGVGSIVMRRLVEETTSFELNALATDFAADFYASLGWLQWLGPLAVRSAHEVKPTPGETVFIYTTPATPLLDRSSRLVASIRPGHPW